MLSNSSDYINNLLNQLAYVDIGQNWESGDNLCDVIERSGDSELAGLLRDAGFEDYTIKDYENNNSSNGFAAIAFENPETGEVGMSFRGTENLPDFGSDIGGILSGDDEAINNQIDMIDNASTAIAGDSSQARDALSFFERNRFMSGNNYLYGHSKGGELASQVYARYYFLINGVHVINPQPINTQRMTDEQKKAFQDEKFDAIVIDGDLVWKLGDAPYPVRIVQNNGSDSGFFGPHMLTSATYDDNGNAVIEEDPFKDYFWQKVAGEVTELAISGLQELYVFVESFIARKSAVYVYRDFSESSKQKMLGLVTQVESEKWGNFTDWVGDRWYDFESWIGTLNIRNYINNVNTYHKKVIDKNNATEQTINRIFEAVWGVDAAYATTLGNVKTSLEQWLCFIDTLSEIVEPGKGRFNGQYMASALNPILKDVSKANVQQIKDTLMQNVSGEPVFDEELLLEYIKKNPAQMTDEEKQAVLEVIAELQDTVAFYESAASIGNNELGADFWNRAYWASETEKYASCTAVSEHYNNLYAKVMEGIQEVGEDSNTFAAEILHIGNTVTVNSELSQCNKCVELTEAETDAIISQFAIEAGVSKENIIADLKAGLEPAQNLLSKIDEYLGEFENGVRLVTGASDVAFRFKDGQVIVSQFTRSGILNQITEFFHGKGIATHYKPSTLIKTPGVGTLYAINQVAHGAEVVAGVAEGVVKALDAGAKIVDVLNDDTKTTGEKACDVTAIGITSGIAAALDVAAPFAGKAVTTTVTALIPIPGVNVVAGAVAGVAVKGIISTASDVFTTEAVVSQVSDSVGNVGSAVVSGAGAISSAGKDLLESKNTGEAVVNTAKLVGTAVVAHTNVVGTAVVETAKIAGTVAVETVKTVANNVVDWFERW